MPSSFTAREKKIPISPLLDLGGIGGGVGCVCLCSEAGSEECYTSGIHRYIPPTPGIVGITPRHVDKEGKQTLVLLHMLEPLCRLGDTKKKTLIQQYGVVSGFRIKFRLWYLKFYFMVRIFVIDGVE